MLIDIDRGEGNPSDNARDTFGLSLAYLYSLFALVGNEAIVDEYINCIHSILARHYSEEAPLLWAVVPVSKEALASHFASNIKSVKKRGFFCIGESC